MILRFDNNACFNLETELIVREPSYTGSGDAKKAARMAREAEKKYKIKLGIYRPTLWERMKSFIKRE